MNSNTAIADIAIRLFRSGGRGKGIRASRLLTLTTADAVVVERVAPNACRIVCSCDGTGAILHDDELRLALRAGCVVVSKAPGRNKGLIEITDFGRRVQLHVANRTR